MNVILVTDSPKNYGLAYFYYLALFKNKRIKNLQYISLPHRHVNQTIFNRILNRTNNIFFSSGDYLFKKIFNSINRSEENINLILFNSSSLNKNHLRKIDALKNVSIFNYISDHLSGMSKKKLKLTIDSFRYLKKTFVFSDSLIPVVYQYGSNDVRCIPFGFCEENHYVNFKAETYVHNDQICYFGTWGPLIEEYLYLLKDFNLKIYGNYWEKSKYKILRNLACSISGKQSEMSKLASKVAVVINFTRAQHGCLSSMKTFELAASGACVVTNRNSCQLKFFPESAFSYFDTKKEMVDKISKLLYDVNLNISFRLNAQKFAKNFSYGSRSKKLITFLKD